MKKATLLLSSILCLILLLPACGITGSKVVTFESLFADPQYYNGREITIEGYFFSGWETIVLAEKLDYYPISPKTLTPGGNTMWVEGGIPKEIYDKLYEQQGPGPYERFGKVKVTGKFEYGGKYGHVGGSNAQITPLKVELLDWSPPPPSN